jgi:hypothetical protein
MDILVDNTPKVTAGAIAAPEQTPLEPPQEIKEMTFSTDSIPEGLMQEGGKSEITIGKEKVVEEKAGGIEGEQQVEAPKQEEKVAPKKEEKKSILKAPETKVEDKPKVTAEEKKSAVEKPIIKPITPVKEHKQNDEKDTFDYTPFAPAEVTNLKNMSRQSREWASELLKSNRELSKAKDGLYLQHEGAYTLSPEYNELQRKDYLARVEAQAWQEALLANKAGKNWKPITGFDAKTGNPIYGQEQKPSDQAEILLNQNLLACNSAINQNAQSLQQFPQRFKQVVSTDLQAIKEVQKGMFDWHNNAELLNYKIGDTNETVKQARDEVRNRFPIYMQSHPAVDVVCDLVAALKIRDAELREAQSGRQVAETKKEELQRAEPTSDNLPGEEKPKKKGQELVPSTFSVAGATSLGL